MPTPSNVRSIGRILVVDVCSGCGSQVEYDADGPCCEGAKVEPTEVFRPEPALPPWTEADEARWQGQMAAEHERWLVEVVGRPQDKRLEEQMQGAA